MGLRPNRTHKGSYTCNDYADDTDDDNDHKNDSYIYGFPWNSDPMPQPSSKLGHAFLHWFCRCPSLLLGWGMHFYTGFADAPAFF